ncbi:uncharacterized protein LOC131660172 [Vicia villosa]|uniref:uncharacterized protein LOC131660172 n=1 Tax=Vicia villosa TaxID=3911 RepID=UPI00273B9253|nr:uncharacterized protein LOC131660172 [Vicia villosa]
MDGGVMTSQKDIANEVLDYYGNLMGKDSDSLHHIDIEARRRDDMVDAVMEFFDQGRLYRAFSQIMVTLIPSTDVAKYAKDHRPIARCTTFYKIISKILTSGIGKILPSIISLSQFAFVPGQINHNHIMLAYKLLKSYTRKGGTPRCMM